MEAVVSKMSKMAYDGWIETYVSAQTGRFVRGKCSDATLQMIATFPELRRVCGFVYTVWGRDQHWWCVAPDGEVVDPTAEQFPIIFGYEELDPELDRDRIPTGRCMNCGVDCYGGKETCSSRCYDAVVADLG